MTGAYINSNTSVEELANQIDMDPNATTRERHMVKLLQEFLSDRNDSQEEIDELESKIDDLEAEIGTLNEKISDKSLGVDGVIRKMREVLDELESAHGTEQG